MGGLEFKGSGQDDLSCRGASEGTLSAGNSTALDTDTGLSSWMSSPPSTARAGPSGACAGGGIPYLPEVPSSPYVNGGATDPLDLTVGFPAAGAQPNSTPRGRAPGTWRSGVDGQA